jgi:hypothetical protein
MKDKLEQALLLLQNFQQPNGEFKTFESNDFSKEWVNKSASPFVTANVILSVKSLQHPIARDIWNEGAAFIASQMEFGGFWRFWKLNAQENNVPLDTDDTSLCAYILEQNGKELRSTRSVLNQLYLKDGLFYTWILASFKLIWHPRLLAALNADARHFRNTVALKMLDPADVEPAVSANVLLYLGDKKKTEDACAYIKRVFNSGKDMPMQFYNHQIVVLYHYARMLNYTSSLNEEVIAGIAGRVLALINDPDIDVVIFILGLNILLLLGSRDLVDENMLTRFNNIDITTLANYYYPYFNSKDMIFRAGSPALNIAWYIQCLFLL